MSSTRRFEKIFTGLIAEADGDFAHCHRILRLSYLRHNIHCCLKQLTGQ